MKLKKRAVIRNGAIVSLVAWGLVGHAVDVEPPSLDEALRAGNIQDVLKILGPGVSETLPPETASAGASKDDGKRHRITLVSGDGKVRDLSRTSAEPVPRADRPDKVSQEKAAPAPTSTVTTISVGAQTPPASTRKPRRALPAAQPVQVPLTRPREASNHSAATKNPKPSTADKQTRVTTLSMPDTGATVAPEDRELASKELATLLKSMREPEPKAEVAEASPVGSAATTPKATPAVLDEDRKISKPLGVASRSTSTTVPRTSVTVVSPSGKVSPPVSGAVQDPMQSTRRQLDRLLQEAKTETFGGTSATPASGSRAASKADSGWRYEGRWVEGRMDGIGVLTYPDGWRFDGEWREGVMMGQGTLTHPEGWQYTGEWRNGTMDGHGALTYPDGWKYVGEWRDGKMHGKGELIHPRNVAATPGR